MTDYFDAVVIGTGQAGPSLAVRLASAGRRTAIIERQRFGGTCVNVGCIPTKALIASARAAHVARTGAAHGVMIDHGFRIDLPRVKARKDEVVRQSAQGVEKWLRSTHGLDVIEGHARFVGAHALKVGDRVISAPEIFINAGCRASVPEIPGLADTPYLTNVDMMELDRVPEHLVVVGASYIGLEFAQMYRRFGARVTVVEMAPRPLAREDEATSKTLQGILEREGVEFHLGAKCLRAARRPAGIAVGVDCATGTAEIEGSHLLLAVGRTPNTDDLGLETAGVATSTRGHIDVDDELRASAPGIWALGDVNGRGAFTHTAYNDYEIVAANLLDGSQRRVSDRIPAYALYTDPPLARIGITEHEARASGRPVLAGHRSMSRVGRARERGETDGFMQVLVDAETKLILGACLLGIEADEAIHCLLDAMYARVPYTVIRHAVHIHPTVSELIPTVLGELKPLR